MNPERIRIAEQRGTRDLEEVVAQQIRHFFQGLQHMDSRRMRLDILLDLADRLEARHNKHAYKEQVHPGKALKLHRKYVLQLFKKFLDQMFPELKDVPSLHGEIDVLGEINNIYKEFSND